MSNLADLSKKANAAAAQFGPLIELAKELSQVGNLDQQINDAKKTIIEIDANTALAGKKLAHANAALKSMNDEYSAARQKLQDEQREQVREYNVELDKQGKLLADAKRNYADLIKSEGDKLSVAIAKKQDQLDSVLSQLGAAQKTLSDVEKTLKGYQVHA